MLYLAMALVFFIVLGVLLVLLARETILLVGAILQLAYLLVSLVVQLLTLAIIGTRDIYRVCQRRRVVIEEQRPIPNQVLLVDRGDGLYVPSKGEW
jgi:hypothetical protein